MNDRPIFLLGCHKSGTSLLRALLDGTPGTFAVPFETHFFRLLGYPVSYPFTASLSAARTTREFVSRAASWCRTLNRSNDEQADSVMAGGLSQTAFEESLSSSLSTSLDGPPDEARCFRALARASHVALGLGDLAPGTRIVEKSVEHAEFAVDFARAFPDARFLHIVRNPYANLVAIRKYKSNGRFPFLANALAALKHSQYWAERNVRILDSNYQVIRYEDLAADPANTTSRIAAFLDLPAAPTLLQPTQLGEPWGGNSTSGGRFSAISSQPSRKRLDEATPLETALVDRHLRATVELHGYERPKSSGFPLSPVRDETPKNWLANRLLLRLPRP